MNVAVVLTVWAASRETEYAARIDRLERQAASHQRIEDAVERDAINVGQQGLDVSMAHGLDRRLQRFKNAHTPRRNPDTGSAQ
ncbi:MAG: hypothetical protein AW11_02406 [Candidatus Accumulibacter regalis]|jgi:hypothetical protein|uniref:Uncharacterized protein n=1 Tax=Accumulibacter regalis TaxID=522306 RepID=A0A011PJM2_ACCRE|nr:hypothetical protein [Accumulibacter sp.]EXI87741.1 MAG: hypothetical protein AW11_02406 [Candidatus Accumulibacter regalis]HRE71984.1 hypothetical protein [Accumulibacter sp.]